MMASAALLTVVLVFLAAGPVAAQTAPPSTEPKTIGASPATPSAPARTDKFKLTAGTPLLVVLDEPLSTKTHAIGDRFSFSVAEDVKVGEQVVISKGTSGVGELSRVTTKGAFGKSGKLEARMLYVTVKGRPVRVSGVLSARGQGNTTETVATAILAGTLAFAVTGRSASLAAGTELSASLERDIWVDLSSAD